MTGQPAAKLGLSDCGLVREHYFADLVLFDPARVRDEASFQDPHRYPSGIPYVIVNGNIACGNGTFTRNATGRILGRKTAH
jgi:N-acyl-D-aspartate/D-glutamate deacylase